MKVVQFSLTALAGAPIRVANAVNLLQDISVRHVDLNRSQIFGADHVHVENPELTLALCEEADIIHFYNYVNLETRDFAPVDFKALQKKGKVFVQHFQSTPMLVAEHLGLDTRSVINYPLPKVVIAQYPERFFPNARVVPNIVPQDAADYLPPTGECFYDILYAPSWDRSAWDYRWDTKGMPETLKMLENLKLRHGVKPKIVHQKSLAEVMEAKAKSRLVMDELVTGSYHLSALEGLSLGKPVLAYLDDRTEFVLRTISGAKTIPFVNVRLEDAKEVIPALLREQSAVAEIGAESRRWIETYWRDRQLAEHFRSLYEDLMENPEKIVRQPELEVSSGKSRFFSIQIQDAICASRKHDALAMIPWWKKCASSSAKWARAFIKKNAPDKVLNLLRDLKSKISQKT